MTNDFLLIASVGCLLWVFRVRITYLLCIQGMYICESLGWDAGEEFCGKAANYCFYYHPEWFPKMDKEELEDWRERFEDENLN